MTSTTKTDLSETDLVRVAQFLASCGIETAGPLSANLIAGGRSNLTYLLGDSVSKWVLRMPPRTGRTPSAHNVAREHQVTSALYGYGVPVARAVALCADESLIGSEFFVAEFVPGRTVQSREELDTLDDLSVAAIGDRLVRTLADLHRVDYVAAKLEAFGRPDGYAERQIRRWAGQWELVASGNPGLQSDAAKLGRKLAGAIPPQRTAAVVHGDFRIDNTLMQIEGPGVVTIRAVVDWELSTIGDPTADLAMMCAYRNPAFDLIVGAPSAWTSQRLPGRDQLAAAYEHATGVSISHWDFHLALAYFKVAVIAAGIDHRARLGAAAGPGFDTAALSVPEFLSAGLNAIGGLP
jgi:aminoglycoside phosphotransferase (APT) family kinase protein